ncbi:MAG: hypothetical protein JNL49_09945 [Bacteroidia bacterium]|nr:hypothetical protein [Bacteroidia bacterium]
MEFKDLFEFFAAVGAMVSAFLSYQAVNEMKKQREANTHPEIIFGETQPIHVLGSTNSHISIPYIISNSGKNKNSFDYDDPIAISIYNIGLAPAKKIKIDWNFDRLKAWQLVKEYNTVGYFEISKTKNGYRLKTRNGNQTKFFPFMKSTYNFKYIINSPDLSQYHAYIYVPHDYIALFILYQLCGRRFFSEKSESSFKTDSFIIENFPLLYADVSYFDLHGKPFYKKIEVALNGWVSFDGFPKLNEKLGILNTQHNELPKMVS